MSNALSQDILNFCRQRRTLDEIEAEFGDDRRVRFTVYNMRKRGELDNVNAVDDWGRRVRGLPGLFVVTKAPAAQTRDAQRWDASALTKAWRASAA